ncbi:MAG: hypothetical protein Q8S13_13345 [Dehalococcoidia bacterium]|nr:hypothetical protein [Dehalococcoidia bacterium]
MAEDVAEKLSGRVHRALLDANHRAAGLSFARSNAMLLPVAAATQPSDVQRALVASVVVGVKPTPTVASPPDAPSARLTGRWNRKPAGAHGGRNEAVRGPRRGASIYEIDPRNLGPGGGLDALGKRNARADLFGQDAIDHVLVDAGTNGERASGHVIAVEPVAERHGRFLDYHGDADTVNTIGVDTSTLDV